MSLGAAEKPSGEELRKMDACWRTPNYLSVGQIYLMNNPLLKRPLKREDMPEVRNWKSKE